MRVAYVDTSCLAAVTFGERGAAALARRLATYGELLASNLLEAELRAACAREQVTPDPDLFTWVSWVFPDRPLTREIALLTLDERRGAVAAALGCGA